MRMVAQITGFAVLGLTLFLVIFNLTVKTGWTIEWAFPL
jgi:hypothetical protein